MRTLFPLIVVPALLAGQAPSVPTDTPRTARGDSIQALEAVVVRAVRARSDAPVSASLVGRAEIERRSFGQDVPLLLQGSPSLTSYAETGSHWGYSYLRVRGIDQSRINLTIDGIPLNDPEDQVLYFADFPDLSSSLGSIQLQRGVGTTAPGTASYGGSINLETLPLTSTPRDAGAQLQGGSFASLRGAAEYASGLSSRGFAAYARASALQSDGYRRHSGTLGRSGFLSAAWVRERDMLKLTATAGLFADTLAYVGATKTELEADRRFNPLRSDETDRFGEQLAALSYTRYVGDSSSFATTVYRISARGNYDVCIDRCDQAQGTMWNFHLDFAWYGASGTWNTQRGRAHVTAGVNANTYARDHYAYERPDLASALYFNTVRKGDASAFARVSVDAGPATFFGDVQGRRAAFRYLPDPNASIAPAGVSWAFLNPKAGVTLRSSDALSWYASVGINGREPARSDLLGGLDNLTSSDTAFVGALDRVRPEHARDVELGMHYGAGTVRLDANVFHMAFRDEILPVGRLTYIGTPLRANVASSRRTGIETDLSYRPGPRVQLGAAATWMTARIADFTDEESGLSYHGVRPLLTPALVASQRATVSMARGVELSLLGRYNSTAMLTNTGDEALSLPAYYVLDGGVRWAYRGYGVSVFVNNIGSSRRYGGGHVSGGEPRYYVLAPRNAFVRFEVGM